MVAIRLIAPGIGEIRLRDDARDYLRTQGGAGWGLAPVAHQWFEGAGDGAVLRSQRRAQRAYTLPTVLFGGDRQQVEDRLRAWARVVRDPFRIQVDYPDGRGYWISAAYDSGASGVYSDSPERYADLSSVTFICGDPYWTSTQMQSFAVRQGTPSPGLLPWLSMLMVSQSAAFGEVPVTNVGDVHSAPRWTVRGPGHLTVSVDGRGFSTKVPLSVDDVLTIRKERFGWTVKDQSGANRYGSITPGAIFPEFPPGESTVVVVMTGTTMASSVVASFAERREIVY